jgi:hypothetical protein
LLLGQDWIHANGCVPSMLHQCLIQWIGDDVDLVTAKDPVCIAVAEVGADTPNGSTSCDKLPGSVEQGHREITDAGIRIGRHQD